MGFVSLAIGGLGFVLIGVCEALSFSTPNPNHHSHNQISIQTHTSPTSSKTNRFWLTLFLVSLLSSLVVLNSAFSLLDALNSRDRVGSVLQLQTLAIASLFLLYAIAGALSSPSRQFPLPSSLVESIALFAFAEEFLLFYLQRKDTSGIENRYFDLVLVPIAVCGFSTVLGMRSPGSSLPRFGRGIGLVLQGTWFGQMAVSFHTAMVAHGCSVHSKSRGNYTVKCTGHPEYHRARAIATLQFNCHLALLVPVALVLLSVAGRSSGGEFSTATTYIPIAAEMQGFENLNQFSLDSDDDDNNNNGEILKDEEEKVVKLTGGSIELGLNGHK